MRKLLTKVLVFTMPFWLAITIYIYTDVFRVIWHYDTYIEESDYFWRNKEYVSTMTYYNQNPKYHYDSFIFGNSRSAVFRIDSWKKYLPNNSKCFHFDASGGTIGGLRDEIKFIDKSNGVINNALIVLDNDILSRLYPKENSGHIYVNPPMLRNDSNLFSFHWQHFCAFWDPTFLRAIIDYNLFGVFRPYMKEVFIEPYRNEYNSETNELKHTFVDKEIEKGVYYDDAHISVFKDCQKPGTYTSDIEDMKCINCLKEIKDVLNCHHTKYKVIIPPLYDQVKLNRKTFNYLCEIFGKENVYDFSGVTKWSMDYHYYYEQYHFRPIVADEMMKIVYTQSIK